MSKRQKNLDELRIDLRYTLLLWIPTMVILIGAKEILKLPVRKLPETVSIGQWVLFGLIGFGVIFCMVWINRRKGR